MTNLRYSFLSHLECAECGTHYSIDIVQNICPVCTAPLLARYFLDFLRNEVRKEEISRRQKGMWRWHEVLPVKRVENIVSLGEGDAPLLKAVHIGNQLGLNNVYVKEEGQNPTGSFKARGLGVAISKAYELGVRQVIIPTAGNAGGAMAAYAARAGIKARIYMPEDTPEANSIESTVMDAEVIFVRGNISDAAKKVNEDKQKSDWFDVSTFKEPYRVEGKKIMGYELAESFGWELPDVILYPTGGGTGLVGMWKAFQEMENLGWLKDGSRPRMIAVQAEGCAPVVKAFHDGKQVCDYWEGAETIASGLRVPKSFADKLILQILRESNGDAVAVSDKEILLAQAELGAREGIFAAPEGAATLAALIKLVERNQVTPDERVVLFNTGSGLKYLDIWKSG